MHHVLQLPEILEIIFRFNSNLQATTASCARVCKRWSGVALDVLWFRLDHFEHLLRILGPMNISPNPRLLWGDEATFVQSRIPDENWPRFYHYSSRIRHLKVAEAPLEVHRDAFTLLTTAKRPGGFPLCPNLTHLIWGMETSTPMASIDLIPLLFLAPRLEGLDVQMHVRKMTHDDVVLLESFFDEVIRQSPCIKTLQFTSIIDLGPPLARFLAGLVNLRRVRLAEALLTPDAISVLSRSPYLQSIHIIVDQYIKREDINTRSSLPLIEPGAFPLLEEIELKAGLEDLMDFLSQPTFPTHRLRRLLVQTELLEDNTTIAAFVAFVADRCPDIREFSLGVGDRIEAYVPCLPFTAIEPLLQCASITHFSLSMCVPLEMDNTTAARLTRAWPGLREFCLVPLPAFKSLKKPEKWLTVEAVEMFARCCPLLCKLTLYIHPLDIPVHLCPPPSESLYQKPQSSMFPNLEKLSLGLMSSSYIPEDLARFLGSVTPATCSINAQMVQLPSSEVPMGRADIEKLRRVLKLVSTNRESSLVSRGIIRIK
ncbi:hypothetical protein H0H92_006012 [Tricholoma furcatifolium]|nr:hypothetical protein H0H92_006012 [Tricholoma furcatifolium]